MQETLPACHIVWFRNDLRVRDHRPLYEACRQGLPVVAIYVYDELCFSRTTHYQFPKIGVHRARFIEQSVVDMQQQLDTLGIPLWIGTGSTVEQMLELSTFLLHHRLAPHTIYYSEETGQEEVTLVQTCKQHLELAKWTWQSYRTGDLYDFADLPPVAELPQLFTTFRMQIENRVAPPPPLPVPSYQRELTAHLLAPIKEKQRIPSLHEYGFTSWIDDPRNLMMWKGGSLAAHQRLHHYIGGTDYVARYKLTRNGLLSPNDSSRLSPWLANGCVSPREVYAVLLDYERTRMRNESTYWLWFELLWREYFRHIHLKWHNRLFMRDGLQRRSKPWSTDIAKIEAWLAGNTGYALVDASMRELAATGYTTNRARQNAASFLTQTWQIDWLVGAEWYESQLLDYDPASNYGNWQYLAGVGNDARQDRRFDVDKQMHQYDPEQHYVRHWLADR